MFKNFFTGEDNLLRYRPLKIKNRRWPIPKNPKKGPGPTRRAESNDTKINAIRRFWTKFWTRETLWKTFCVAPEGRSGMAFATYGRVKIKLYKTKASLASPYGFSVFRDIYLIEFFLQQEILSTSYHSIRKESNGMFQVSSSDPMYSPEFQNQPAYPIFFRSQQRKLVGQPVRWS